MNLLLLLYLGEERFKCYMTLPKLEKNQVQKLYHFNSTSQIPPAPELEGIYLFYLSGLSFS